MCNDCKRMICPSNCPSFAEKEDGSVIYCRICGERIFSENGFYQMNGFPYCTECLDFADSEMLVRICEMSKRKWLEKMGFLYTTDSIAKKKRGIANGV